VKVALYGRKSQGEAPEVQLRRLREAALAEGHEIVLEAQDVATGTNPNRPGWALVSKHVRAGWVQSVWITKTDRAMRSTLDYLVFVNEVLGPRNCKLKVLDQPMASVNDANDPLARAFRTIGATIAELEGALAAERSNEGHYLGDDGYVYGPSGKRVGRPFAYGPDHKFRVRNDGRREHDRAKCRVCRGETPGQVGTVAEGMQNAGVGEPNGFPTPEPAETVGQVAGAHRPLQDAAVGNLEISKGGSA